MTQKNKNLRTAKAGSLALSEPVFLLVGRLLRTHGLHGELVLDLKTDFPERIERGKVVYCGEAHIKLIISRIRTHDRYLIVSFNDIESMEDARKYVNLSLFVQTSEIESLPEGFYYFHELIGKDVFENGQKIGRVFEILETGANDVMIVKSNEGKEILVPFIEGVIQSVDIKGSRINVNLPEWL